MVRLVLGVFTNIELSPEIVKEMNKYAFISNSGNIGEYVYALDYKSLFLITDVIYQELPTYKGIKLKELKLGNIFDII
jgi:hypothetical protein